MAPALVLITLAGQHWYQRHWASGRFLACFSSLFHLNFWNWLSAIFACHSRAKLSLGFIIAIIWRGGRSARTMENCRCWRVALWRRTIFDGILCHRGWHIYGQILIGLGLGSAGISIAIGALARSAPEKRSLAIGLVTSFGSFGQFALVPVTQF